MKTITIKYGCFGRYDDVSPFLVEDGALSLHFVLPRVSGEFYLVVSHPFADGETARTWKIPETGDVELSDLRAGELHAVVRHTLRGELVEEFPVEPLLIKSISGDIRAFPEIGAMEEEIGALKLAFAEAEQNAREELTRLEGQEHARDAAFLAYAWAEYQSDVQLNAKSLPVEEFIAALGYDVSEFSGEELEKIIKFKEIL